MWVGTVNAHVSRVLAKLGLNNRVQIALLTYDAGLLEEGGHWSGAPFVVRVTRGVRGTR